MPCPCGLGEAWKTRVPNNGGLAVWHVIAGQASRPILWLRSVRRRLNVEKRSFRAGIEFISEELVRNMQTVSRIESSYTKDFGPSPLLEGLSSAEWDARKESILRLRDEDPVLWEDLTTLYNRVIRAKTDGQTPAKADFGT
jgi:hypothetical protein